MANIIFGQEYKEFEFDGKVSIRYKLINEVEVTIYDEGMKIKQFTTAPSGKFIFKGSSEKHYSIQFEQEGYETKRIAINTDNTRGIKEKIAPYRFKVTLNKKPIDRKLDHVNTIVGVIEINSDKTKFIHNTPTI
jgi:hypothetical protein